MARHVALFRAINVAGHARLSHCALVHAFRAAGARDVTAFGHAGNVLFSAASAPAAIAARAARGLGRTVEEEPLVVVRSAAELRKLAASNPFSSCAAKASDKLYVAFLLRAPRKQVLLPAALPAERLTAFARQGRNVLLVSGRKPSGFYGLPNGFVEAAFGVPATTRSWSTVLRLASVLEA